MWPIKKSLALLAIPAMTALALAACAETRYVAYEVDEANASPFSRSVAFKVAGAYYRDPPDCAVVMPFLADGRRPANAAIIENALVRHLSAKVASVVAAAERRRLARALAVDLSRAQGRAALARAAGCGFLVEAAPWGGEGIYALVWTQARIGLDVRMIRARDDRVVWHARHVATRSEGGLPLSPFSAVANALTAARFNADGDVAFSLADDAVRRIFETLPDTRPAAPRRGRMTKSLKTSTIGG